MENIDKIRDLKKLNAKKEKLQREIATIDKSIANLKKSCLHIGVNLGGNPHQNCCVFCGKGKNNDEYFYESNFIIHAEKFLPQLDIKDEFQKERKYQIIQKLTQKFMELMPELTYEELTNKINDFISSKILNEEDLTLKRQKEC